MDDQVALANLGAGTLLILVAESRTPRSAYISCASDEGPTPPFWKPTANTY